LNNTTYFEKLVHSVTRIARHAYYPGKEEAIELCLQEIDDLEEMGRIGPDQRTALRDLLLGEEDGALVEGLVRERERADALGEGDRIAVFCEGAGSLGAFSAGVLSGLLERAVLDRAIIALGGTAFGSLSALLAWDGLIRNDPGRAIERLERFWSDYSAASVFDGFVNYSTQLVLQLRALVPLPGLGTVEVASLSLDHLRCLIERQIDCAEARALASREGACALALGAVDDRGDRQIVRGPGLHIQPIVEAAAPLHLLGASTLELRDGAPATPASPVGALLDSSPSEIWLIQVRKVGRGRPILSTGELADHLERQEHQLLDQELRFVQTVNTMLSKGVLLGDRYRPIEVHRIIMEHDLDDSVRVNRSPALIDGLIRYGKERANLFLQKRRLGLSQRAHRLPKQ
jgi:hypothetical protein